MTVIRIWTTAVDAQNAPGYDEFAKTRSLPMFTRQPGCQGVWFCEEPGSTRRSVITVWNGPEDLVLLERSASYRNTVDSIAAAGLLTGSAEVVVLEVTLGDCWAPREPTLPQSPGRKPSV